jgi:hypothetical protein
MHWHREDFMTRLGGVPCFAGCRWSPSLLKRRVSPRATFPQGTRYLRVAAELEALFTDDAFLAPFPTPGQPAQPLWQLAFVTLVQFAAGRSARQPARAAVTLTIRRLPQDHALQRARQREATTISRETRRRRLRRTRDIDLKWVHRGHIRAAVGLNGVRLVTP